jgi:four helix bundle protein
MSTPIIPIRERTFNFAAKVIDLCRIIDRKPGIHWTISNQLGKSGTSIGAQVEEAYGAQSEADFIAKFFIGLKEARETDYWLRLVKHTKLVDEMTLVDELLQEIESIKNIIGAILVKKRKS